MPTTAVTADTTPGPYSTTGTTITWTAADVANGNHVAVPTTGTKWILLARNVHAATTYTVTITSVALAADTIGAGRTGDVAAVNIAAGAQKLFQLTSAGWKNSSDQIAFSGNNANIQFAFFSI